MFELVAVHVLAAGAVVALVGALLVHRVRAWRAAALPAAALVAVQATAGSLLLSEVLGFVPCQLCWVQRSLMYPAAVLLTVAAAGHVAAHLAARVVCAGAAAGAAVAGWHYWLQWHPDLAAVSGCGLDGGCGVAWVWLFGFVSIPLLSMACFTALVVLTVPLLRKER